MAEFKIVAAPPPHGNRTTSNDAFYESLFANPGKWHQVGPAWGNTLVNMRATARRRMPDPGGRIELETRKPKVDGEPPDKNRIGYFRYMPRAGSRTGATS